MNKKTFQKLMKLKMNNPKTNIKLNKLIKINKATFIGEEEDIDQDLDQDGEVQDSTAQDMFVDGD